MRMIFKVFQVRRPRPLMLVAAVTTALLLLSACGQGEGREAPFRLGFLPAERAQEFSTRADALASFLEERMGVPVEVSIPTAYEPLIEALRFGNLDAAFMDAAPAWIAHERAGVEVVLAEIRESGETFYWAEGFTLRDSDVEGLEDLVGKRVAHTSWTGSSGFVMPIGAMISDGLITPAGNDFPDLQRALSETFASYTMAGGYKAAMELLVRGQVDAAFGADDAPERFLSEEDRQRVRPFVRFGRVPSHPIVVSSDLPEARRAAFVQAMVALTEERPDIYRDLYGVVGVTETTTEEHLGDFGRAVRALPGLHQQFLDRR